MKKKNSDFWDTLFTGICFGGLGLLLIFLFLIAYGLIVEII